MTSMAQKPSETPARVEVQGSSHQATVCGQPYRYLLPEHTQRKIFTCFPAALRRRYLLYLLTAN